MPLDRLCYTKRMYFATPPLRIIDRPADARHTAGPRSSADIWYIVLHATVGGLASSLNWLTTNPNSTVSVHRLIDQNGDIYKIVDDLTIANHVGYSRIGNKSPNPNALGIEFVNNNSGRDPYEAPQLISGVNQVAEWWGMHGPLPILSHAQVDTKGKTDPAGFPWSTFYRMLYSRLGQLL
jgi:N-acetyl-anhydromuramyl-L-alanine amidase AmpD